MLQGSMLSSLPALGLVLQGEVSQLTRRVWELGDEAAGTRQKSDRNVKDVLFERDRLHILFD